MNASHPIAAGTTLLLLLTSCGTMNFYKRTASPPKRALALDPANRRTAAYTVGLSYRYATGPEGGAGSGKEYFRDAYQSAGNEVQKQQVRNEIAKDLVALIDENHAYYHDSLRRALTTNSILGDLFKLGFDTAGVIT